MISKRIQGEYKNKYGTKNAVEYIADKAIENMTNYAANKTEKAWYINLPQDKELAIAKMQNTQAMNTTTTSSKIYHYTVSFPDGEKPNDKIMLDIEKNISEALGYKDYQRVIAIHDDTGHYHMHIVVNTIHPTKHINRNSPSNDYYIRNDKMRMLEKKYSLTVDNGIEQKSKRQENKNYKALDFEAHTGLESFTTYLKQEIKENALNVNTWQELHTQAKKIGVIVKLQGNGLVFKSIRSKETVKASTIDRKLSKSNLEQKLGNFTEFQQQKIEKNDLNAQYSMKNNVEILNPTPHKNNSNLGILGQEKNSEEAKKYEKRPIHKNSNELWQNYQEIEKLKLQQQEIELQNAKTTYSQELQKIKYLKKQQKEHLKTTGIKYKSRLEINLNIEINAKNAQEQAYSYYKEERSKIYQVTKKCNWLEYLIQEAKTNPIALKILQSNLRNKENKKDNKIQSMEFLRQNNKYIGYGIIAKNGEIHYKTLDNGHFKAGKDGIYIIKDSLEARTQALEVASKTYGNNLKLQGSEEFIKSMKIQAKAKNISISDNQLER